jgi:hypothetical protein
MSRERYETLPESLVLGTPRDPSSDLPAGLSNPVSDSGHDAARCRALDSGGARRPLPGSVAGGAKLEAPEANDKD